MAVTTGGRERGPRRELRLHWVRKKRRVKRRKPTRGTEKTPLETVRNAAMWLLPSAKCAEVSSRETANKQRERPQTSIGRTKQGTRLC